MPMRHGKPKVLQLKKYIEGTNLHLMNTFSLTYNGNYYTYSVGKKFVRRMGMAMTVPSQSTNYKTWYDSNDLHFGCSKCVTKGVLNCSLIDYTMDACRIKNVK
ncbi:hypothetical protein AK88_05032 [Plasmodium fragile]|uniref:Uncharacterized protein n=1 Tax=Plasmodium fragile TaxID=5857 RepID=A0A0D9QE42_PLAFR|nr:uncharacterized protein AK88_05032 [Plasmodium fragile]KJP85330.1 hypothetical protein AK88_05032 [Plasmodium fragile]